jgi:hypothetical protein
VTPPSPNDPRTNLTALLISRGWQFNAELSPTESPVWDFMPSLPNSGLLGSKGHPTGIFIHSPEEPGFCTVEPANWSTLWNPYARTFRGTTDLITCLPQIEHWRAPTTVTHATPAELARLRAIGGITTAELMYSLKRFPYFPRYQSTFGVLRLIRDVGLLTPQEFELIAASIRHVQPTKADELIQE